jgi:hypothetical protein
VRSRHVDLAAERRLREADRHVADDVVAIAREQRVLADVQDDVQIALRSAVESRLALAAQLQP